MNKIIVIVLLVMISLQQCFNWNKVIAQSTNSTGDTTKHSILISSEEPKFLGGDEIEFILKNISYSYPELNFDSGENRTVVISMQISEFGKVTKIEVLKSVKYGCTEAVLKVLKSMDKWQPGKINGISVNSRKVFTIKFPLPK